jgi:integrase
MVSQHRRGSSIRLKAYAGTDPDTRKRCYLYDSLPAEVGKRELARRSKALEARAHRQAMEWRRIRREGLTPREQVEQAETGEVTFADAAAAWLDEHLPELEPGGRIAPPKLLNSYVLPYLGGRELWQIRATLTPKEAAQHPSLVSLKALYRQLAASGGTRGGPLSAGTLQRVHSVIGQVLGYAYQRGWVAGNVARETRPPTEGRGRRPLPDPGNMGVFLGYLAVEDPLVHLFALLVMSGPRPNEAAALRISSFDLGECRVRIGAEGVVRTPRAAGGEEWRLVSNATVKRRLRTLRLPPGTVEVVRARLMLMGELADHCRVAIAPDAFLFSREPDGTALCNPHSVSVAFTRLAKQARKVGAADVPAGMHLYDMRHYGITSLLAAGHPVADVAERFGTSARMIYGTYAHAIPEQDDGMAATLEAMFRLS